MNKIPFLRLRMEPEHAREGMDLDQMGIACYEHIEEIKVSKYYILINFNS